MLRFTTANCDTCMILRYLNGMLVFVQLRLAIGNYYEKMMEFLVHQKYWKQLVLCVYSLVKMEGFKSSKRVPMTTFFEPLRPSKNKCR